MNPRWIFASIVIISTGGITLGDTASDHPIAQVAQDTKDAANRGLDKTDSAVHKAGHKVKKGAHAAKVKANQGLDAVDSGVHKTGSAAKDSANEGLQKVDDTVHGR